MKVLHAKVIDPRMSGEVAAPYMLIGVDEEPSAWGPSHAIAAARGLVLTIRQHGPFWHIEPTAQQSIPEEVLVGMTNTASPAHVDKLVPVEVRWGSTQESFAMPITRARRLLRKFEEPYTYSLSDVAARHGRIQWDLERQPTLCMFYSDRRVCGLNKIADTITFGQVNMPACSIHISAVRRGAKNLRLEREGARR